MLVDPIPFLTMTRTSPVLIRGGIRRVPLTWPCALIRAVRAENGKRLVRLIPVRTGRRMGTTTQPFP
jgi:hypothetical protein